MEECVMKLREQSNGNQRCVATGSFYVFGELLDCRGIPTGALSSNRQIARGVSCTVGLSAVSDVASILHTRSLSGDVPPGV